MITLIWPNVHHSILLFKQIDCLVIVQHAFPHACSTFTWKCQQVYQKKLTVNIGYGQIGKQHYSYGTNETFQHKQRWMDIWQHVKTFGSPEFLLFFVVVKHQISYCSTSFLKPGGKRKMPEQLKPIELFFSADTSGTQLTWLEPSLLRDSFGCGNCMLQYQLKGNWNA